LNDTIIVVGLGEMGSVFSRGFLKLGHPVYPATRTSNLTDLAKKVPNPHLVLVAVGEADLQTSLDNLPGQWRNKTVLLQNELLPRDWQGKLDNPTVISVWFEKKKGQDSKVIIPSPAYGPHANLIKDALATLDISCKVLNNKEELLFELVRKNVYILTSNLAGLVVGGNVSELWAQHRDLATNIVDDVLKIQEKLTETQLSAKPYIAGMIEAIEGDPNHKCMGRSAPQRLKRALQQAHDFNIETPALNRIET